MEKEEQKKESFFKKNYQVILGVLVGLVVLLFIGGKKPEIKISWFIIITIVTAIYFFYNDYLSKIKYEDIYRMAKKIKEDELKHNSINLDLSDENVSVEEMGFDRWAINFHKESRSYIRSPSSGKTIGVDCRTLPEIRKDYQKLAINRAIAEGKINNIEVK